MTVGQAGKAGLVKATRDSLVVQWSPVDGANVYRVEWSEPGYFVYSWTAATSKLIQYTITGLKEATAYVVRITAGAESAAGTEFSAPGVVSESFTTLTLAADHTRLQQELRDAKAEIKRMEESTNAPVVDSRSQRLFVELKDNEIRELKTSVSNKAKEIDTLRGQVRGLPELQRQLAEASLKVTQLEGELKTCRDEMTAASTERDALRQRLETAVAERRAAESDRDAAQARLALAEAEHKSVRDGQQDALRASLQAQVEAAQAEARTVRQELALVNDRLTAAKEAETAANAALQRARDDAQASEARLQEELRRTAAAHAQLQTDLQQCSAEVRQLQAFIQESKTDSTNKETTIQTLTGQNQELSEELKTVRASLDTAQRRCAEIVTLNTEIEMLRTNLAGVNEVLTAATTEKARLQAEVDRLQKEKELLSGDVARFSREAADARRRDEELQTAANARYQEVSRELEDLRNQKAALEREIVDAREAAGAQVEGLRRQVSEAEARARGGEARDTELSAAVARNLELQDQITALRSAHSEELANVRREKESLNRQVRDITGRLDDAETRRAAVVAQVQELEMERSRLASNLSAAQMALEQTRVFTAEVQADVTRATAEKLELQEQVARLNRKLTQAVAEATEARIRRLVDYYKAVGLAPARAEAAAREASELVNMGFDEELCRLAVAAHPGNPERQIEDLTHRS